MIRNGYIFIFSPLRQNQDEEGEEVIDFRMFLCQDVLFEILQYGSRRALTKIEKIGRRVYYLTENYLSVKPLLRLNIHLSPKLFSTTIENQWRLM